MRRLLAVTLLAVFVLGAQAAPVGATPPSDVELIVATSLTGGASPFEAYGPAVDDGIVCASGYVFDAAGKVTGASPAGFNFQGIKQFVCADGSGEFSVNLQARIDFKGVAFSWNVLRGIGEYADLHGAGRGVGFGGVPCGDPDLCVLDVYQGGLHID